MVLLKLEKHKFCKHTLKLFLVIISFKLNIILLNCSKDRNILHSHGIQSIFQICTNYNTMKMVVMRDCTLYIYILMRIFFHPFKNQRDLQVYHVRGYNVAIATSNHKSGRSLQPKSFNKSILQSRDKLLILRLYSHIFQHGVNNGI